VTERLLFSPPIPARPRARRSSAPTVEHEQLTLDFAHDAQHGRWAPSEPPDDLIRRPVGHGTAERRICGRRARCSRLHKLWRRAERRGSSPQPPAVRSVPRAAGAGSRGRTLVRRRAHRQGEQLPLRAVGGHRERRRSAALHQVRFGVGGMSGSERRKGAAGELELLELVRARWPRATRNFASGAAGNGDIAHGPAGVLLECKRTERLRIRDAWAQASRDAERAALLPVLATRWSRGPWLAIVELDELLALLELRERS